MRLVEKHQIRRNHNLYKLCDKLCFQSKNLYNAALYEYRQSFIDKNSKNLNWVEINKLFNSNNQYDYRQLPAKVSNLVLKKLGNNITSFLGLLQARKDGTVKKVKLPKYLHKTKGRFIVEFTNQTFSKERTKKGYLVICKKDVGLVVPTLKENVKQVRIVPRNGYYVIEVVYEVKEAEKKKNVRVAAIDLGLNNLVTAVTNDGDNPLIVSGRKIKSINQYFNKAASKKKALLPKGIYTSKTLDRLWLKRNNTIDHEIHKISKYLVNYFDERDISKVVIGNNTGWKNEISLGKRQNQNFVNIPYMKLISQLIYKCKIKGIEVIVREESYTSKASFYDYDFIPTFNDGLTREFSGKRVKRGMYQTKNGKKVNADVNGAYNIMIKENSKFVITKREQLSYSPVLIKL